MARSLRMPTSSEVPSREVRSFVEVLFNLYRQARRPPLRRISAEVERSDAHGTASPETIRRVLRGITVPSNWETVEAVLFGLCRIIGLSPDDQYDEEAEWTLKEILEARWNEALDHPHGNPSRDPWSDEPPF
jgi:hypothetical protein